MKVKLTAPKLVQYMTVPQACAKGDAMSGYYVWGVEDNKAVKKNIEVSDDINNNLILDGINNEEIRVSRQESEQIRYKANHGTDEDQLRVAESFDHRSKHRVHDY